MADIRIEKQKDGRHAVMHGDVLLGLHKSIWSAARQVHDHGGPAVKLPGQPEPEGEDKGEGPAGLTMQMRVHHAPAPRAVKPRAKLPVPPHPKGARK